MGLVVNPILVNGRFIPDEENIWHSAYCAFDSFVDKNGRRLLEPSYNLEELRRVVIKYFNADEESAVLSQLSHPNIPEIITEFCEELPLEFDRWSPEFNQEKYSEEYSIRRKLGGWGGERIVMSCVGDCTVYNHFDLYEKHMTPEIAQSATDDILNALQHLHEAGYAHSDLHLNNVRMNDKGQGFVIDFEECVTMDYNDYDNVREDISRALDAYNFMIFGHRAGTHSFPGRLYEVPTPDYLDPWNHENLSSNTCREKNEEMFAEYITTLHRYAHELIAEQTMLNLEKIAEANAIAEKVRNDEQSK